MRIIQKLKSNKKTIIILLVILAVGIFLRTYKFHDWMRFSSDQSRDATIISNALENKVPLPLLGPKANTTTFQLGPAYYYFSYATAKIFGDYPDKMAYPSLFSGILAIPILYLFLREYFEKKISLALTALMSVAYFLVISSRFSSNPNLIPPFLLLYLLSLVKILNREEKKFSVWSLLAGASLGICVQLHTTPLVILPIATLCVFIYLFFRKFPGALKSLAVVFAVALALNATQVISEFNTHGKNYQSFLGGFHINSHGNNLAYNTFLISACQIQANASMISSVISSLQTDKNSQNASCADIFQAPGSKKLAIMNITELLFLGWHFLWRDIFFWFLGLSKKKMPIEKIFWAW